MTVPACDGHDRPDLNTILRRESPNIRAVNHQDGVVVKAEPKPAVRIRECNLCPFSSHRRRRLKPLPVPILQKEKATQSIPDPERSQTIYRQYPSEPGAVNIG